MTSRAFVAPPTGLVAPRYLASRAALIGERAMGRAAPGDPDGMPRAAVEEATLEPPATSHLSIVDAAGNAVATTPTTAPQSLRHMADGRS